MDMIAILGHFYGVFPICFALIFSLFNVIGKHVVGSLNVVWLFRSVFLLDLAVAHIIHWLCSLYWDYGFK